MLRALLLKVIFLWFIMLSVIILNAVVLNVVVLKIVAPYMHQLCAEKYFLTLAHCMNLKNQLMVLKLSITNMQHNYRVLLCC
jgi:hypothetical protein